MSESDEAVERTVLEMADVAKEWDHHEFASRTVGLLIMDEGNLNKYQRTLELVFRIHEAVLANRAAS